MLVAATVTQGVTATRLLEEKTVLCVCMYVCVRERERERYRERERERDGERDIRGKYDSHSVIEDTLSKQKGVQVHIHP